MGIFSSIFGSTKSAAEILGEIAQEIVTSAVHFAQSLNEQHPDVADIKTYDAAGELIALLLNLTDEAFFNVFGDKGRNVMFDPVSQKVVEVYSECCLSDDTDSDNLAVFAQHLINKINARSTLYASCISFSPEEGRSSKGSRKFAFMHFVHKSLGYTDKVLSDAYLATTGAIEKEDLEALPDFRECMELEVVVATSVKQLDLRNRCKGIVKALKRM